MSDPKTITPKKLQSIPKKQISESKKKQKMKARALKINEKRKESRLKADKSRGVIYIGHLPYGFFENEIREYFKQFGTITNSKICRSSKTGRSKGYGFVEFKHPEVAKVAAETMDNYIMCNRRIVAEYVPYEKRAKYLFYGKQSMPENYSRLRRRTRNNLQRNKKLTEEEYLNKSKKMNTRLQQRLKLLQKVGIDYDLKPADVPEKIQ